MTLPSSLLYALTLDDWTSIALYWTASELDIVGPPSGLLSLLLVSRHLFTQIRVQNNARLYAELFRFKFDTSAPKRRLTERWMTDRCLASELVKRFTALRRIRDGIYEFEDLWTCYLMLSENDGKNEQQLLNWARLRRYLNSLMVARAHGPPQPIETDTTVYALTTWLMWMTSSRGVIKSEHPQLLKCISSVLHPLMAAGYLHPSSYAPEICFQLPLCGPINTLNLPSGGTSPPVTQIMHYSHPLMVSYPLSIYAATLLWTLESESCQDERTFNPPPHAVPRTRGDVPGWDGPTLEDLYDFHFRVRLRQVESCAQQINDAQNDDNDDETDIMTPIKGSRRFDEDWTRLVACYNPCLSNIPLRGQVYRIGSLCGSWAGRYIIPHLDMHFSTVLNQRNSPLAVPLFQKPLYWTLREHHCLSPDEPLSIGIHESGVDDILNAWLPRGYTIQHLEDAIEVFDPYTGRTARYETFIPRDPAHYSKQACEKVKMDWISGVDEEISGNEGVPAAAAAIFDKVDPNSSYIDNDDEYADNVEYQSSGVSDILVTGETGQPGDAWGHFTVVGRVRPWDGFVVLLQIPPAMSSHVGPWIFKGYIHDQNLVGRWRETSTAVGLVGLEGAFVVTRREVS
ncbi:hypothetical protein AMATHDRAFT_156930 [Amanita thiersii Skay4041]|uniref:F-box domain-containing protein n=1 Tax=Amanita thiersii Skay4041 TaxID=703135 RepID=A0A2A9N7G4_9AGAR|nr:hypothetical protein AMATHDRAFT_156930 [Amanita thiersii Skay4041]